MIFKGPMIIVKNIEKSKKFYKDILKQVIELDLETYLMWNGGFSMMSENEWKNQYNIEIQYKNNNFELYFEVEDIDEFINKINNDINIKYFHKKMEAPWGQNSLKVYDPDGNIIEIGESIGSVIKRYFSQGMSVDEVASKTMLSKEFVEKLK